MAFMHGGTVNTFPSNFFHGPRESQQHPAFQSWVPAGSGARALPERRRVESLMMLPWAVGQRRAEAARAAT
jgi:hypothetical protein